MDLGALLAKPRRQGLLRRAGDWARAWTHQADSAPEGQGSNPRGEDGELPAAAQTARLVNFPAGYFALARSGQIGKERFPCPPLPSPHFSYSRPKASRQQHRSADFLLITAISACHADHSSSTDEQGRRRCVHLGAHVLSPTRVGATVILPARRRGRSIRRAGGAAGGRRPRRRDAAP